MAIIDKRNGYGNSAIGTFTIGTGADGSVVTPIDLLRHYGFLVIRCADITNVATPASDTVAVHIGMTDSDDMLALKDDNGAVTIALDTTFHVALFIGAAQRVRLVLSANASGGSVVFEVYGIDAAAQL